MDKQSLIEALQDEIKGLLELAPVNGVITSPYANSGKRTAMSDTDWDGGLVTQISASKLNWIINLMTNLLKNIQEEGVLEWNNEVPYHNPTPSFVQHSSKLWLSKRKSKGVVPVEGDDWAEFKGGGGGGSVKSVNKQTPDGTGDITIRSNHIQEDGGKLWLTDANLQTIASFIAHTNSIQAHTETLGKHENRITTAEGEIVNIKKDVKDSVQMSSEQAGNLPVWDVVSKHITKGHGIGVKENDVPMVGAGDKLPSSIIPFQSIGRTKFKHIKESSEKTWWKDKYFKDDAKLGDLAIIVEDMLEDWVLEGNAVIEKDPKEQHEDGVWCIRFDSNVGKGNKGRIIFKTGENVHASTQIKISGSSKGKTFSQKITLGKVKLYFEGGATEEFELISAKTGDYIWTREEKLSSIVNKNNAITHMDIEAGVYTDATGMVYFDDMEVLLNIGSIENPLWSKNYAPEIAPDSYTDFFLCSDENKARNPTHDIPTDDGWTDVEMQTGIVHLNGHMGRVVHLRTGDVPEGQGKGKASNMWFTEERVRHVDYVDEAHRELNNAKKIFSLPIDIAGIKAGSFLYSEDGKSFKIVNPLLITQD